MRRQECGFTLIELLVSIAIVSILASLAVANMNEFRENARDAEAHSAGRNLRTLGEMLVIDMNLESPNSIESVNCFGGGTRAFNCIGWNSNYVRTQILTIVKPERMISRLYITEDLTDGAYGHTDRSTDMIYLYVTPCEGKVAYGFASYPVDYNDGRETFGSHWRSPDSDTANIQRWFCPS